MTYRVPLPPGSRRPSLDLIEPNSASVLRFIRRNGLGEYEPPTAAAVMAACEAAGDELVLYDVGSNIGLYSHLVASILDPRRVIAFEPTPATANTSRRIARRNRLAVDVVEAAVGEVAGTAQLFLSPVSDASNSLVEGFRNTTESTEVEVVTVDGYVQRSGLVPSVLKIDVETFEREVLRGARATIERHRPVIIIEVLKRKGRDHGVELTEEMSGLGYHYYALPADPTWEHREVIHGLGTTDRDWLLLPEPISPGFIESWHRWRTRLGAITLEQNPRVPIALSVQAAYRRGGIGEVSASARRYGRSLISRVRST